MKLGVGLNQLQHRSTETTYDEQIFDAGIGVNLSTKLDFEIVASKASTSIISESAYGGVNGVPLEDLNYSKSLKRRLIVASAIYNLYVDGAVFNFA